MPAEKTTAIVLKVVDFSETSCVVTLFTRDFGKISALAKGARRNKNPFEGALDVLAICRIVFLRKSVDTLDLLTEAKLMRRFQSASQDLSRFYASLYVIELVKLLTDEGDSNPELFDLVCETIKSIDVDDGQSALSVPTLVIQFELRMLMLLGHSPSVHDCVGCGTELGVEDRVPFGLLEGGVFCQNCRTGKRNVVSIHADTIRTIRGILNNNTADEPTEISLRSRGEVRGLMDQVIANMLGFRPRMYPYLRQIFKN